MHNSSGSFAGQQCIAVPSMFQCVIGGQLAYYVLYSDNMQVLHRLQVEFLDQQSILDCFYRYVLNVAFLVVFYQLC